MTKPEADFIANIMENAGKNVEVRDDYSGRGMFGKTTCGVVVDSELLVISALLAYAKELSEDGPYIGEMPEFDTLRHDNMGKQMIIY